MGRPNGDRFEVFLSLLAAQMQNVRIAADSVEILHFAITDIGRSLRERASEILNREHALRLGVIPAISAACNLPIASLAAPYRLEDDAA
ncbi:transcriptional regulator [Methylobacterium phyllostachyos]|uniref:transcriptional regulator n=1 Tax=Methylobacterium phyllostachyos TaxID=582672 RepID=UPI00115FDAD1|nr:transcriptional regulator [Methylobacterium phyllostachyos]